MRSSLQVLARLSFPKLFPHEAWWAHCRWMSHVQMRCFPYRHGGQGAQFCGELINSTNALADRMLHIAMPVLVHIPKREPSTQQTLLLHSMRPTCRTPNGWFTAVSWFAFLPLHLVGMDPFTRNHGHIQHEVQTPLAAPNLQTRKVQPAKPGGVQPRLSAPTSAPEAVRCADARSAIAAREVEGMGVAGWLSVGRGLPNIQRFGMVQEGMRVAHEGSAIGVGSTAKAEHGNSLSGLKAAAVGSASPAQPNIYRLPPKPLTSR